MNNPIYRVKLTRRKENASFLVEATRVEKTNDEIVFIVGPYRMTAFDGKKNNGIKWSSGYFHANYYSFRLLKRKHL